MKKTILAMLLAGALVCGACVGCGESGGTQQGESHTHTFAEAWSSDGEFHWHEALCGHADAVTKEAHSFTDGECTVCHYFKIDKETDAAAIVSDRLTEEEWKAALSEESLENFLCFLSYEGNEQDMAFAGEDFQSTLTVNGKRQQSMVFEHKDGKVYAYVENEGEKWNCTVLSEEEYRTELLPHVPGGFIEFLRSGKDKFGSTEYDESLGAYLFTIESDEPVQIALKFKNGRLCGFGLGAEGVYQFGVVYGYGEAKVTPPEEYTDMESPHSHTFAEAWSSDGEFHWHEALCGHADAVTKEAHSFTDGECTVCHYFKIDKETDVAAIVSDKLTEEEWKGAFSEELFENFMLFSKDGEQESDWAFAGMNFRFAPSEQGVGNVAIGIYAEEKFEYYETDEYGKWQHMTFQKGEDHYESMQGVFGYVEEIRSLIRFLKEKFTQAVFDETLGAYLFTETDAASGLFAGQDLAFKFKNGRLCGLGVGVEGVYQFTVVYGYGEAEIAPPASC